MTKTQALELLTKKVEKQGKHLQEEEIKSAQALAKAVGYLPLALELAADQVASGTSWQVLIEDIKQEIARLKSFKDPGIRNISDDDKFKKLSLQASLNLSIKRLEENDREYFAWLRVLPENASITPKMTATLWNTDERDAEETLQYLRSQALLLPGVFLADGTATYRLHDLFHDLARNLLTEPQKPKRQGDLIGLGMKWENVHAQLLDKYQQQTENNLWHTLPDDGYIHQHLVWHLEKAGKVEEIHQLLREESASGNNGWYEVRERFGQTAGFLTDIARAWELGETDWGKKNLSQVVGLQCRYGLIIASLNSLAVKTPTEVIVKLVKNQYWYPEQGLAYVLRKQDTKDKAHSVIALADYLPEVLKHQALQKILEVIKIIIIELNYELDNSRFTGGDYIKHEDLKLLISLIQKSSENFCKNFLKPVRQISNQENRVQTLLILAEKFNDDSLYQEALELARQIIIKENRVQTLLILAEKFNDDSLYKEALEIVRQIKDDPNCTQALSVLLGNLSKYFYKEDSNSTIPDNLYNQALNAVCQIKHDYSCAITLSSFAYHILSKRPIHNIFDVWKEITKLLFKLQRQELLNIMERLAPVIFNLGGKEAFIELANAIQDVSRWWR